MASAKPTKRPAFDSKTFSQRLYERVRSLADKPYTVFDPTNDAGELINFPRYTAWLDKLRDVVAANAVYLDDVKNDLDRHRTVDNARHEDLAARVSALEEAASFVPFGVSGSTGG